MWFFTERCVGAINVFFSYKKINLIFKGVQNNHLHIYIYEGDDLL